MLTVSEVSMSDVVAVKKIVLTVSEVSMSDIVAVKKILVNVTLRLVAGIMHALTGHYQGIFRA